MKSKMMIFTSPTCPNCPPAKKVAQELRKERDDFDLIELSTMSPEGIAEAGRLGIRSVPTFIISGPGFPELIGLQGQQDKKVLNKYLDKSLGIEAKIQKGEIEKKGSGKDKGFLSRFRF
ncbi:hypothetical protein JW968_06460 [Candidatus Woesearchaeota archaeon]|nr:hypothetical protein [Candidatus Woesearchaeota archaeon]